MADDNLNRHMGSNSEAETIILPGKDHSKAETFYIDFDIEAASMQKNCGADNLGADILGDMSINDEALGGGEVSGDEFTLEGFQDLNPGGVDDHYLMPSPTKRARPAFFDRTTKAVERSARRTKAEESETFIIDEGDNFLFSNTSKVRSGFGRANREKGSTLPAYHKKVSWELDSDDELMMAMRDKGYSDRQISDKLAKDGRARYDPKSISTRIGRIKNAQAERMDWLLQEGLMEWTLEDDQLLVRAYDLADMSIREEIERIRAWRFRKVAEFMRHLNKGCMFSANACRERYAGLVDGTAKIPIELDDNPEARIAERNAFILERQRAREAEEAEKAKKEAAECKVKEEAKARQSEKAAATAARRAEANQKKAERAAKRAAKAQERAQRSEANKLAREQRAARIQAEKDERERKKREANQNNTSTLTIRTTSLDDITEDTPDPRLRLSIDDLKAICKGHGMSTRGKSKEVLVQRLKDNDDKYSVEGLRKLCRSKGLNVGTKTQMLYQLALATAKNYEMSDEDGEDADGEGGDDDDDMEDADAKHAG